MGYRDDAYWQLGEQGEPGRDQSDNAKFLWPSNKIRHIEAEKLIDGDSSTGYTQRFEIKRGYIRGLPQPGIYNKTTFPTRKCQFQFNPQTIVQTVTMREDVYMPLMQDPVAFTQPFAGSVNFNFDLLFDRSMEVAGGRAAGVNGYSEADLSNPNYKEDVRDIGVLADLQVLYSIIGQGFSAELLEFQKQRLAQAGRQIINKNGGSDPTDPDALNEANIETRTEAYASQVNVGNAAFLIPNPVRIVFSSLFMVEGFITGTNVDFLKFSTNMVPLQVKVSLSVNAVYIGYAKRKTFLTDQLEKEQARIEEQQRQVEEKKNELVSFARESLGYVGFSASPDTEGDFVSDVGKVHLPINDSIENINRWIFKTNNLEPKRKLEIGIIPAAGKTLPAFSTLKDSESSVIIDWELKVYGPFDMSSYTSPVGTPNADLLRGLYSGQISSDTSDWGDDWAVVLSGNDTSLTNNAPNAFPNPDMSFEAFNAAYKTNKYYKCFFKTSVTITSNVSGDQATVTKSGYTSQSVVSDHEYFESHRSAFAGKISIWSNDLIPRDGVRR